MPRLKQHPFALILVNVRSRFNVGAMFRTADAVGVDKIYLTGYTPAPPHPKIDKVALGSEKTTPFENHRQTVPLLKRLKKQGYLLAAIEQSKNSVPYSQYKKPKAKPLALIVGNEVTGLTPSILKLADVKLEIPMRGKKESLNVGIAFGIVAYRLMYP